MTEKSGQGGAPSHSTMALPSRLKPCTVCATSWGSSSIKSPRTTMSGKWCLATSKASGSISHTMIFRRGPKSCVKANGPVPMPSKQLRTMMLLPVISDVLGTSEAGPVLSAVDSVAGWSGIPLADLRGTPCCPYFLGRDQPWSHWSLLQDGRWSCCQLLWELLYDVQELGWDRGL